MASSSYDPVLVSWGESRMALAATRALGHAGLPVAVLAEQPWAPAWHSRYCVERVTAPDADQGESYLEFLEARVRKRTYSGLFFCDDRTALQVGRQRARFEPYVPLLLPPQTSLELTMDKAAMIAHASKSGIDFPRTAFPADAGQIDAAIVGMRFPLIVKGSGGFASRQLQIIQTPFEARPAFLDIQSRQLRDGCGEPPHVQEYVSGTVFSAIALCRNGEPEAIFMMRKNRTYPTWGGVCVEAESVAEPGLEVAVRRLLSILPWHGVIEIEFLRDERNGRYLLIEPSPDPNWGLDLAIAAGMNVPYLAWRLMRGLP